MTFVCHMRRNLFQFDANFETARIWLPFRRRRSVPRWRPSSTNSNVRHRLSLPGHRSAIDFIANLIAGLPQGSRIQIRTPKYRTKGIHKGHPYINRPGCILFSRFVVQTLGPTIQSLCARVAALQHPGRSLLSRCLAPSVLQGSAQDLRHRPGRTVHGRCFQRLPACSGCFSFECCDE